uniref:Alpha-ketoglutarate dehydrogenase subunit 4 n=2 Tax=Anser TaxID=8842 RepID=A0A8B9CY62_9AVES|nr:alpha-ketoglutarate dehydrogenase component 4 isoform X1 [Anser cygnoides]
MVFFTSSGLMTSLQLFDIPVLPINSDSPWLLSFVTTDLVGGSGERGRQYHGILTHPVQESLQASVPSPHASKAQESVGGRAPAFQSISPVSRVQGTPDTSELARTFPQKYRRKLMSDEEIEYIQRGGPE